MSFICYQVTHSIYQLAIFIHVIVYDASSIADFKNSHYFKNAKTITI